MALVRQATELAIPRGRLRVDPFDASELLTGETEMGNVPSFTISIDADKVEHYSSQTAASELDNTFTARIKRTAKLKCDNMSAETYRRFLTATSQLVDQLATPVVDELRAVIPGRIYQLGQSAANPMGVRGVKDVTVQPASGNAVYEAGKDFNVEPETGSVQILEVGKIVAGDVKFGYTPLAGKFTRIKTGGSAAFLAALRIVADNAVGGNRDWYMPRCSLTPSGDLPLITDDNAFVSVEFNVDILKPANAEAIYCDGRPVGA